MRKFFYTLILIPAMLAACDSGKTNGGQAQEQEPKEYVPIELTRTEEAMVISNNGFAFDLYRKIHSVEKSSKNVLVSPLSLTLAFSMLNNGAAGETLDEMMETLGYADYTPAQLNTFYRKMLDVAVGADDMVTVETANSIWVQDDFPVKDAFVEINKKWFDAEVRSVDFLNPATLKAVNDWASAKTHGKIEEMLTRISPATVMLLMNALYFKGEWTEHFDEDMTSDGVFTAADGTKRSVRMMQKTLNCYYAANGAYSSASLFFGNGAFQMQFILPNEGVTLSQALDAITDECVDGTDLGNYSKYLHVKLPRFSVAYDTEEMLTDILEEMGMKLPFDSGKADFSELYTRSSLMENVFISLVKQKAFIEVDEAGAEAAAVTVISMVVTAAGPGTEPEPTAFFLDRPFLFLIRDSGTGAIYFMGEVNDVK